MPASHCASLCLIWLVFTASSRTFSRTSFPQTPGIILRISSSIPIMSWQGTLFWKRIIFLSTDILPLSSSVLWEKTIVFLYPRFARAAWCSFLSTSSWLAVYPWLKIRTSTFRFAFVVSNSVNKEGLSLANCEDREIQGTSVIHEERNEGSQATDPTEEMFNASPTFQGLGGRIICAVLWAIMS